jgi:Plavaka transposase
MYAYNKILHWAQDAKVQGYSFSTDAPQYSIFMTNLKKQLKVEDYVHKSITVEAAGSGTVSFPVFDFKTMFLSLIDDPHITGHLLINWEEPSTPPPFDSGSLDETHSGLWHECTSAKLVTPQRNDIFCGIILAVDCTYVADNKDKLLLEPVLFSLFIIPHALCNHPFAWRPLGFNPSKFSHSQSPGFNTQTYHRVLARMLSGLVNAQRKGVIKSKVLQQPDDVADEVEFCFKVLLAFVIGDIHGGCRQP